jgi:hypothetical protein
MMQLAFPFPAAHPPLNAGFWPDGWAARETSTCDAEAFTVETRTAYFAVCPRWMPDCERWTVTHSPGWATVVFGVGLGPEPVDDADGEAVAEAGAWDGDGDAAVEPSVPSPGLVAVAEAVGELEGNGEGDVDGEGHDGVGEGDGKGVAGAGSSWQVVAVSGEVSASSPRAPARARPGMPASALTVRKPTASRLSAVGRAGAKRMGDACPLCVPHYEGSYI